MKKKSKKPISKWPKSISGGTTVDKTKHIFYAPIDILDGDAAWVYRLSESTGQTIAAIFERMVHCARIKKVFTIENHVPEYIERREITKTKRKERLRMMADKLQSKRVKISA